MKKRLATMMLIMVTVFAMLPVMAWAEQTVSSVNLIYDVADFCLYTSSPEGTVNKNIKLKTKTNTPGVRINTTNTGLEYKQSKNTYIGTDGKTTPVVENRNYYMYVHLQLDSGYAWPEEISRIAATKTYIPITELHAFRVFLNGERHYDEGYVRLFPDNDIDVAVPVANDITSITLSPASFLYDGKVKTPKVTSARLKNGDLVNSRMYTVTYVTKDNRVAAPVNPGTYYAVLEGEGIYGTGRKAFTIHKLKHVIIAKGSKIKIKASKIKKKKQTVRLSKFLTITNAKGELKYKLTKVNKKKYKKYFKVNAANGNITIKKGLKKGTYKLYINITDTGDDIYQVSTKPVTLTIKVK